MSRAASLSSVGTERSKALLDAGSPRVPGLAALLGRQSLGFPGRKWEWLPPAPGQGQHRSRALEKHQAELCPPLHTGALQFPEGLAACQEESTTTPNPGAESPSQEKDPCLLPREGGGERHFGAWPPWADFQSPLSSPTLYQRRGRNASLAPSSVTQPGLGWGEQSKARLLAPQPQKSTLSPVLPTAALKTQITGHWSFQGPRVK